VEGEGEGGKVQMHLPESSAVVACAAAKVCSGRLAEAAVEGEGVKVWVFGLLWLQDQEVWDVGCGSACAPAT
jgi:hypothetical protein